MSLAVGATLKNNNRKVQLPCHVLCCAVTINVLLMQVYCYLTGESPSSCWSYRSSWRNCSQASHCVGTRKNIFLPGSSDHNQNYQRMHWNLGKSLEYLQFSNRYYENVGTFNYLDKLLNSDFLQFSGKGLNPDWMGKNGQCDARIWNYYISNWHKMFLFLIGKGPLTRPTQRMKKLLLK